RWKSEQGHDDQRRTAHTFSVPLRRDRPLRTMPKSDTAGAQALTGLTQGPAFDRARRCDQRRAGRSCVQLTKVRLSLTFKVVGYPTDFVGSTETAILLDRGARLRLMVTSFSRRSDSSLRAKLSHRVGSFGAESVGRRNGCRARGGDDRREECTGSKRPGG